MIIHLLKICNMVALTDFIRKYFFVKKVFFLYLVPPCLKYISNQFTNISYLFERVVNPNIH